VAAAQEAPDPACGVFDTLLVRDGRAVDLRAHVDRVTASVRELYAVPVDAAGLGGRIRREAAGLRTARLRTTYHPASGGWTVETAEIDEAQLEPRTLGVRRVADGLGPHKWVDRRLATAPAGADDVLLVDEHDLVLECGSANVLVVLAGALVTPPLDGRILPGTLRARALAQAREQGVAVVERRLGLAELSAADEVLVTSSVRGVQPVVACVGVGNWLVGPLTLRLREFATD
jgi:para-aminobenzoate synthetase/4-amino-4-deoxychorismate lyase